MISNVIISKCRKFPYKYLLVRMFYTMYRALYVNEDIMTALKMKAFRLNIGTLLVHPDSDISSKIFCLKAFMSARIQKEMTYDS